MSQSDYVAWVSARVVRTFQYYAQNIDPQDEGFKAFISNYLAKKHVEDARKIPYSEVYKIIRAGIREYLAQKSPKDQSNKRQTNPRGKKIE